MKSSNYNIIKKIEDSDDYLVFNSRNCALLELNEKYMRVLTDIEKNNNITEYKHKNVVSDLKSVGLIIEDSENELEILHFLHNYNKFNKDTLTLTIAPTLECNFSCPYCFENKRKGKMGIDIQTHLVAFIKEKAKCSKNLEISWYGGEPLLALDIIENLHIQISKIVKEFNLSYKSFMITNGYLIDKEIVKKIQKLDINSIQITLDGPPQVNDKRRILKNRKGGTFNKILNGVKLLDEFGVDVVLRVNIDKTNYLYMDELLDLLAHNNLKHIKIAFGHVLPYTDECKIDNYGYFEKDEYAEAIYNLQLKLNEKGFKYDKFIYPQPKCVYCNSITINSFLIDPDGFLYKCWCDVGKRELSFGNILNMEENEEFSNNNIKYLNFSPFNNKECLDCQLLPICMGGCPKIALENPGKKACDFWKYNISKMINYIYTINNLETQ